MFEYREENLEKNRTVGDLTAQDNVCSFNYRDCKYWFSHRYRQYGLTMDCLFFQRDDPQQNGVKLLTPVSDSVFNALSNGTIHFAMYGSSLNHNLIG